MPSHGSVALLVVWVRKVYTSKSMIVKTTISFLSVVLLVFTGCSSPKVTVDQIDRAYLADYLMRPDRDDLSSMMYDHAYFSREASRGGKAISAGGCGCN